MFPGNAHGHKKKIKKFFLKGCETITSRSMCVNRDGCGWCADTYSCHQGNSMEPSGSHSYCPSWTGVSSITPKQCNYSDCYKCTNDPSCGWCESSQTCIQGNDHGFVSCYV